jgi:hypothetical protein
MRIRHPARALLLLLCLAGGSGALAISAIPARAAADWLPAYTVTGHDTFVTMPDVLPDGFARFAFVNAGHGPGEMQLFHVNPGVTDTQVLAAANSKTDLEAIFEMGQANGGVNTLMPGTREMVVLRLHPGRYVVLNFNTQGVASILKDFQVRRASSSIYSPPLTQGTVILHDFKITVPYEMTEPEHMLLRVENWGPSSHEMALLRIPAGTQKAHLIHCLLETTVKQDCQSLMSSLTFAGGMAALAPNTVGRIDLDLSPGTYAALCFVPDAETHMPHFAMGMLAIFTVSHAHDDGD